MSRKATVKTTREVKAFAEMATAARFFLTRASAEEGGYYWDTMSSLIFTAFTFEGYLNHLGQEMISDWSSIERTSYKDKYTMLAKHVGIDIDRGRRPYQTVFALFEFRNALAHPRTKEVLHEYIFIPTSELEMPEETAKAKWEMFCTLENAKRTFEDVVLAVEDLHKATGKGTRRLWRQGKRIGNTVWHKEDGKPSNLLEPEA